MLDKVVKRQNRLYYCEDEKIYFVNVKIDFPGECFQTELHDLQTSNKMFDFRVHVYSMMFTQKSPLLPGGGGGGLLYGTDGDARRKF